jgi:hypothetical protein
MYNLENFKAPAIFLIVWLFLSIYLYVGFKIGFKQATQELEKNYNLKKGDDYIKMECDEVDYSGIENEGKIFCKKFKNV